VEIIRGIEEIIRGIRGNERKQLEALASIKYE
jgi:hypothetical protein